MKPRVSIDLSGPDGNIFAVLGYARKALKNVGLSEQAEEMTKKVMNEAKNYDEALRFISDYVDWEL